jgi:hypothetical protein
LATRQITLQRRARKRPDGGDMMRSRRSVHGECHSIGFEGLRESAAPLP